MEYTLGKATDISCFNNPTVFIPSEALSGLTGPFGNKITLYHLKNIKSNLLYCLREFWDLQTLKILSFLLSCLSFQDFNWLLSNYCLTNSWSFSHQPTPRGAKTKHQTPNYNQFSCFLTLFFICHQSCYPYKGLSLSFVAIVTVAFCVKLFKWISYKVKLYFILFFFYRKL